MLFVVCIVRCGLRTASLFFCCLLLDVIVVVCCVLCCVVGLLRVVCRLLFLDAHLLFGVFVGQCGFSCGGCRWFRY